MNTIPYGRQSVDEDDIFAVIEALRSDWLTTGPKVDEFETEVAEYVGVNYGVAVNSGTSALHTAMFALGISPGDEVIVPAITFAATANAVVMQGGTPIFADVLPDNLLIDPNDVEKKITSRTKAIIAVDYAGHPADYHSLREISESYKINLVSDACHALGAEYKGRKAGSIADITTFSFHPVKHITTGEGGMVVCNNDEYAQRARIFRNHGIDLDFIQRKKRETWFYEIKELGYNYRLSDIQCALGISQMKKLPSFLAARRRIAKIYDDAFKVGDTVIPLKVEPNILHAYHLYVIKVVEERTGVGREEVFSRLRAEGIGVNVHYIPVHLHPFYRINFGTNERDCPVAEREYQKIISLPIFPAMTDEECHRVIEGVDKAAHFRIKSKSLRPKFKVMV